MSVEALGGGASVGSSGGGNNVGHECRIGIDLTEELSEQQKKQSDSLENAAKVDNETGNNVRNAWRIVRDRIEESCERAKTIEESSEQEEMIEEFSEHEEMIKEFSEEENKLFDSFDETLKAVNKDKKGSIHAKPKIQKVPSRLNRRYKIKFRKYFLPKVISFGPYYHPYRVLSKTAKQIKVSLAADFLQQNDVEKKVLYVDIKKQIKKLKGCYDDDLTKTYKDKDHELAWMFLEDGCAILQFIYISVHCQADREKRFRKLGIKPDYAVLLAQDLFLLENQIPYQLLHLIIQRASKEDKLSRASKQDELRRTSKEDKLSRASKEDELRRTSKEDELLESIYKFIFYRFRTPFEWYVNKGEILNDLKHDHVHLLDLLRKMLIQPIYQMHKKHDFIEIIIGWTADIFDYLRCNRNEYWDPVQFPNIGKLREAGINLKPSETSCVTDISFIGGTLKLPPIILDESTTSTFLNILGYEMCLDFHNESEFISYMYFLDKLIDRPKDLDELREKNILRNQFGRDEDVAELFNEIGSHLFPNDEIYSDVTRNINKYFNNKGFMGLRKVIHDIHQYFKNRWSLLALIAALLALASGIIQTVYTVFGLSR